MEETTPENLEEVLEEGTLNTAEDDEFASIREHFESGIALTDEETDKVADLAVDYLKKILAWPYARCPPDGADLSHEQQDKVLLPHRC